MILQASPGIYLASLIAGSLLYVGLMLKQSCCQIILFLSALFDFKVGYFSFIVIQGFI